MTPADQPHLAGLRDRGGRPALHLLEPDLGRVSGGLRYNAALADGADRLLGTQGLIQRHAVPGAWPHPTEEDEAALHTLAAGLDAPVVVDGLIGSSLRRPLDLQVPVIQLLHAPLAESDPSALDRERSAMHAADAVLTTSRHAVKTLKQLTGIWATPVEPGVEERPVAQGSPGGNHLICVGAVEPNKNQVFLTSVLLDLVEEGLTDWHITFAGPHTDPAYAARLIRICDQLPPGTATVTGELDPAEVDALYHRADLLLLPSHAETFGMVVTEAASAALPALVTAGTGAEQSLVTGQALPLDEGRWAQVLETWLTTPGLRAEARADAVRRRSGLRTWQDTADELFQVLHRLTERTP